MSSLGSRARRVENMMEIVELTDEALDLVTGGATIRIDPNG